MSQARVEISEAPLVSVVIPSYKKGAFLREAVQSILSQDYPRFEIVIVNDGSPDNTREVAEQLIREYSQYSIALVDKPNTGVSDSRNAGLSRTVGKYVATLDGDDKAAPNFLSTGVRALEQTNSTLFYTNVHIFGAHPGEWLPHNYNDYLIRYDNCIPIMALYDRRLFEKTGGYKKAMGFAEDWEYWVNCSRHGLRAIKSEEKLFWYRSNDSGIASAYIHDGYQECIAVVAVNDDDLYPVEELLSAHSLILTIRPASYERALVLDKIHPNQWFLKFWFALLAESAGRYQEALDGQIAAMRYSDCNNWQPVFRAAILLHQLRGKQEDMLGLFNLTQTLRPDMMRYVKQYLTLYVEGAPPPRQPGRLIFEAAAQQLLARNSC